MSLITSFLHRDKIDQLCKNLKQRTGFWPLVKLSKKQPGISTSLKEPLIIIVADYDV